MDNERVRYRKCLKNDPGPKYCVGKDRETRACAERFVAAGIGGGGNDNVNQMTIIFILVGIISLLLILVIVILFLTYRRNKPATGINNIPKSPCFDSPANEYTCLPTKDVSIAHKQIY